MMEISPKTYEQLEKENAFLRSRLNDLKGDCAFYEQQLQEIGKQLIDTESKCELYKGMIPSEDMRFKARRYDGLRYSRLFACYLSGIFSAYIFITRYQYPDTIGGLFQWYFIPMIFGFLFGSLVLFFSCALDSFVGIENKKSLRSIYIVAALIAPILVYSFCHNEV